MTEELPEILRPESQESYQDDTKNYFRNVQHGPQRGNSADDLRTADSFLPTGTKQESDYADRVDLAANKVRRSGARVNDTGAVPAIFMQGMKETSELIDQSSPGKYQVPEEMKPPDQQIAPTGHFDKAEAMVEGFCLDCCQVPEDPAYVLGVAFCSEEDSQRRAAIGVSYGATVLYQICMKCFEHSKSMAKDSRPLVLIFDGEVTPDRDIEVARKHGFMLPTHTGHEKTMGQYALIQRADRLMDTLWNYLIEQNKIDGSRVFRNRDVIDVGS